MFKQNRNRAHHWLRNAPRSYEDKLARGLQGKQQLAHIKSKDWARITADSGQSEAFLADSGIPTPKCKESVSNGPHVSLSKRKSTGNGFSFTWINNMDTMGCTLEHYVLLTASMQHHNPESLISLLHNRHATYCRRASLKVEGFWSGLPRIGRLYPEGVALLTVSCRNMASNLNLLLFGSLFLTNDLWLTSHSSKIANWPIDLSGQYFKNTYF